MTLPIYSVTPFTLLDFPQRTACIVWFSGCNMRCGYCHNPQIVKGKGRGDISEVLAFLEKRRGLLDGVVLSGGEASLYGDLPDFARQIRRMGYAIKMDTNGLRPDLLHKFLEERLLDYVALDYKAPSAKFRRVTGTKKHTDFLESLSLLCDQKHIPFEIRTTVHTDLMDENDVADIIHDLDNRGYTGTYFVQNFRADNDRPTLGLLPLQKRHLDVSALPRPQNFSVSYRNF
jgi:pyruvate formate lyase activating enzyme